MNDSNAKIIVSKQVTGNGSDPLTQHVEYVCPCGKGKIIYENVRGFDDRYAWIECDECSKKYDVKYGNGHFWELVEK